MNQVWMVEEFQDASMPDPELERVIYIDQTNIFDVTILWQGSQIKFQNHSLELTATAPNGFLGHVSYDIYLHNLGRHI